MSKNLDGINIRKCKKIFSDLISESAVEKVLYGHYVIPSWQEY